MVNHGSSWEQVMWRLIAAAVVLSVAAPLLIRLVNTLVIPFVVLVVLVLVARLIWFHTRT
jgi:hypothetical protein